MIFDIASLRAGYTKTYMYKKGMPVDPVGGYADSSYYEVDDGVYIEQGIGSPVLCVIDSYESPCVMTLTIKSNVPIRIIEKTSYSDDVIISELLAEDFTDVTFRTTPDSWISIESTEGRGSFIIIKEVFYYTY